MECTELGEVLLRRQHPSNGRNVRSNAFADTRIMWREAPVAHIEEVSL